MRLASLVLLLLVASSPARAQLAGAYTVGGTSPDYATLGDAFADLEASGVSGPVLLQVRYGTYSGALSLGVVPGVSATNRIVVRGLPDGTGDLPTVETTPAALTGWVVDVAADYVTVEDLTIRVTNPFQPNGNVLRVSGDHVEIRDCEIESVDRAQATSGARAIRVTGSDALIVGNTVTGGTRGIDVGGSASGQNTRIRLNTVEADSLGIQVVNQADAGAGDLVVRANTVSATISAYGFAGIRVMDVTGGAEVSRNQVTARRGLGIELVDVIGSAAAPTPLANNMATVIEGSHPGIRLEGSTYVGVVHNTAWTFAVAAPSLAVVSGAQVQIRNNLLFAYSTSSYTLDVTDPAAVLLSDTNGHTMGIYGLDFRARWGGTTETTLAAFQATSGMEAGSSITPFAYVSSGDLHLTGTSVGDRDLRAPALPGVSVDVDGDPRDPTHPYLGADEAGESLADPPPLNGLYVVRPDGLGDYVSFDDVLNDLVYGGVSGPVQFSVVLATYTEHVTIPPIPGVSAANPITFLGLQSLTTKPKIRHAPDPAANWVLRVESNWVTFDGFTIENSGTDPLAGRAVHVTGGDVTLDDCEILGYDAQDATAHLTSPAAAVFLEDAARAVVTESEIPRAAVAVHADLGASTEGPTITATTIAEPYTYGLWIQGGTGAVVEDNVVDQTSTSAVNGLGRGVWMEDPQGAYRVQRNEITLYDLDGLLIERGSSTVGSEAVVANNLITAVPTGGGSETPLTIRETTNLLALHNTLYTSNNGTALVTDDQGSPSSGLQILNTIADGGAHAVDLGDAAALAAMDHNVFWGGSNRYVVGGVSYGTFDAYRAATGFDANSHEVDPAYVLLPFNKGTGDLRLDPAQGGSFRFAGTPLAAVPTDVDGDARSATFPYIGADELAVAIAPLVGAYEIDAAGGGDYDSLADFIADLDTRGMGGAVEALLYDLGTFTEAVTLGDIAGAGPGTPLTFRAQPGHSPVIEAASLVLDLDGAHDVTFEGLTFRRTTSGNVGELVSTRDVTFADCRFEPTGTTGSGLDVLSGLSVAPNLRLTVRSSTFVGGGVGVDAAMVTGLGSASPAEYVVEGNTFTGQATAGVVFGAVLGTIADNLVLAGASSTAWTGIVVDFFGADSPETGDVSMRVERNRVAARDGTGISWGWSTASAEEGATYLIANNAVRMSGNRATVGIDLNVPKSLLVAHNTVYLASADTTSIALDVGFCSGSAACNYQSAEVRNNILIATGGRAMEVSYPPGAVEDSEWNLFSTSGPTLIEWWGTTCRDLACYQALSDLDYFSSEGTPVTFANVTQGNLHLAGASVGDPALAGAAVPGITTDVDGDPRPGPGVYIGADEAARPVSPPRTDLPLVGTFTVRASGGDFATVTEATDRLFRVGLGGHAAFEIEGGTYSVVRMVGPIPGASKDATITYRPAPDEAVTFEWNAFADYNDAVWEIQGTSHVTLENLTLRALGSSYHRVAWVYPRSFGIYDDLPENVTFRNVQLEAPNASAGFRLGIHAEAAKGLRVEGSTFDEVVLLLERYTTQPQHYPADAEVVGNTFSHVIGYPFPSVWAAEVEGLQVEGNTLYRVATTGVCGSYTGISVVARSGGVTVAGNSVLAPHTGIAVTGAVGGESVTATVVNNQVAQPTGACLPAMRIDVPDAFVLHNSILGQDAGPALVFDDDTDGAVDFRHNVVVSTDGPALSVDPAAVLNTTDPNALWSDGAVLAQWHGTDTADLAALQAASGAFATAVETRPTFVNEAAGDLHLAAFDGALVVTPIPSVPTDLDGETRTDPTLMGVDHLVIPNLRVGVLALLQGAYPTAPVVDGSPDAMRTDLVAAGAVPLDQPYDNAVFDGAPAECDVPAVLAPDFFDTHPDIVDWVVVALRADAAGPDVACLPALLREDGVVLNPEGTVGLTFLAQAPADYHVVVYHRNHLAAMTGSALALTEAATLADLAGAAHYGGGALLVEPGLRALRSGDGDQSGTVLATDRQTVWLPAVGQAGYRFADFNLDGSVLADDSQSFWEPNVGQQSGVPGASSLTRDPRSPMTSRVSEGAGSTSGREE